MEKIKTINTKPYFPIKPGHLLPLTNDYIFEIFCKEKNSRRFLAKVINYITDIPYDYLINNMFVVDSQIMEDSDSSHYNDQDVILRVNNNVLNLEIYNYIYKNKSKNEVTANKNSDNQFKINEKFENTVYCFYQICFETYNLFNNSLLINEINLVNVSTGNNEVETEEFKRFHVYLSKGEDVSYTNLEQEKYFKFFVEDNIEKLKNLAKGDEILMDAFNTLEKLNNDSVVMSYLE